MGWELAPTEDSEKTFAGLLVRNVLYILEKALMMVSCTKLDNGGVTTCFSGGYCVLIDWDEENKVPGSVSSIRTWHAC